MADDNVLEIKLLGTGNPSTPGRAPEGTRPGGSAQASTEPKGSAGAVDGDAGAEDRERRKAERDVREQDRAARQAERDAEQESRRAQQAEDRAARQAERDEQQRRRQGERDAKAADVWAAGVRKAYQDQQAEREAAAEQAREQRAAADALKQREADWAARKPTAGPTATGTDADYRAAARAAKAAADAAEDARAKHQFVGSDATKQELAETLDKARAARKKFDAEDTARTERQQHERAGMEARNERRLMHQTLGHASEQAALGGATNMVGAGMKVAGSGALGETAAAMAGGPEAALAMAIFQAGKAAVGMATDRARGVAGYNARIAGAEANAEVRETLADIREASRNSESYARVIDSQSRVEQAARSMADPVRDAVIEAIGDGLETLAEIAEELKPILKPTATLIGMMIKAGAQIQLFPFRVVVRIVAWVERRFLGAEDGTANNGLFDYINQAVAGLERNRANGAFANTAPPAGAGAAGVPFGFPLQGNRP